LPRGARKRKKDEAFLPGQEEERERKVMIGKERKLLQRKTDKVACNGKERKKQQAAKSCNLIENLLLQRLHFLESSVFLCIETSTSRRRRP